MERIVLPTARQQYLLPISYIINNNKTLGVYVVKAIGLMFERGLNNLKMISGRHKLGKGCYVFCLYLCWFCSIGSPFSERAEN